MDKSNEQLKRCFCARCFLPIDVEDKVDIENQNFHRICSMCCVCRTIPSSLKMFYGHVFCGGCFKNHVLTRFRGDAPRMQSNSWCMQWAPPSRSEGASEYNNSETKAPEAEESLRRHVCARCLRTVDEDSKIDIADQTFHSQCAKCYFCNTIPASKPKICYGQLFCEGCFQKYVFGRNRDNPSEFFRNCFEQWNSNPQFADNMRDFMAGGSNNTPYVFIMQGQQPPFCRCSTNPKDASWFQSNEQKKSVTSGTVSTEEDFGLWDFDEQTESKVPESCEEDLEMAAEKIEKLTKYLHTRDVKCQMQNITFWKMFDSSTILGSSNKRLECPKCLWQCGPICVNGEYIKVPVFE